MKAYYCIHISYSMCFKNCTGPTGWVWMSISTSPTECAAQHLGARCSRWSHSACRHCSVLHIEHSLGPCQKSFLSQKSHARTSRTGRSASLTCGPTPVTAKYLTYSCHQDFLHTPIHHTQQSDSSGSVKWLVGLASVCTLCTEPLIVSVPGRPDRQIAM